MVCLCGKQHIHSGEIELGPEIHNSCFSNYLLLSFTPGFSHLYKTDMATSPESCFEICGGNCNRMPSILIAVFDTVIIIRRMK